MHTHHIQTASAVHCTPQRKCQCFVGAPQHFTTAASLVDIEWTSACHYPLVYLPHSHRTAVTLSTATSWHLRCDEAFLKWCTWKEIRKNMWHEENIGWQGMEHQKYVGGRYFHGWVEASDYPKQQWPCSSYMWILLTSHVVTLMKSPRHVYDPGPEKMQFFWVNMCIIKWSDKTKDWVKYK